MKKRPGKGQRHARALLSFLAVFLLVFVLLDVLVFRVLVWRVPDETAWENEPLYSFEHRMRRLERGDKPPGEFRVLVIGSSIATYSTLHRRLERALNAADGNGPARNPGRVRVYMLGRQGSNSLQMLALSGRFQDLKPDLIVWPVNFVDFRLERFFVPEIQAKIKAGGKVESVLARDLLKSSEFRVFSPLGVLSCCGEHLDLNRKAGALQSWMTASYRYRDIFRVGIKRRLYNRFRAGRSYLHYAGVPIGGGGVTHRGRLGDRFEIKLTSPLIQSGLYLQAPRELFASPGPVSIAFTLSAANGRDEIRSWVVKLKQGWQRLPMRGAPGQVLRGRVSRSYYSELKADRLTVRLARNTGRVPRSGLSDLRELRREDLLYEGYSDERYRASFQARVLRFNRAGMEYLHALRIAKGAWAGRKFVGNLPSLTAFARFRNRMSKAGIPLVVANIPENPLSLQWYGGSDWYDDFMKFLGRPAPGYAFYDSGRTLPMQSFYDYHHLSYFGAERFTDSLVPRLRAYPRTPDKSGSK